MNNLKNYIANIIVENRNLGNSDDKKQKSFWNQSFQQFFQY